MSNKLLQYLLSNNPDDVLSKKGIKVRRFFNPLFRKVMMLSTSGKLIVKQKADIPDDKRIIYACTHGFRDDIIFSMKTIDKHVYLLYGSLLDFYESSHGYGLWANGVIIVDRKDKDSRKASINKMKRAIELGADIIMFPEGTWNKNQNMAVQKLYPGIYDVAKDTNALIAPVATVLNGDKCYSMMGDAFDITDLSIESYLEILKLQIKKNKKSKRYNLV